MYRDPDLSLRSLLSLQKQNIIRSLSFRHSDAPASALPAHASFPPLTPDSVLSFQHCLFPDIFLVRQPCKSLAEMINELDFLGNVTVQKHSLERAQGSSVHEQCKCRKVLWGGTEVIAAETKCRLRPAF